MKSLTDADIRELIHKGWMTHDGMWFFHTLKEFGIEAANRLNKAANRDLARIEAKRIQQALGLGDIDSFRSLQGFFQGAMAAVKAGFMDFGVTFPEPGLARFKMGRCFALEGMRRLGVERQYECGVFNRVEGWFEALDLPYEVTPKVLHCMALEEGRCWREYRFALT